MKQLTSLFLALLTLTATAQINYPYNPDENADAHISTPDLMEFLLVFGNEWEQDEIQVDSIPLSMYLSSLEAMIQASALPAGTMPGQFLQWDGESWELVMPRVGCTLPEACNYDPTAHVLDEDKCILQDACGVCDGPGAIYDCGCAGIPEGECDCEGNVVDALGACGGTCAADEDGDGICDDGDSCVGEADECGVCNGPGAVYECGCTGIAFDECDCAGTPDVDQDGICDTEDPCIGVADSDGDGICDNVDDCFGPLDLCGVCNGPGPIFTCGCSDIPEGDCDCSGNQPDEDGNCLPYAVDTDGNGILDSLTSNACVNESELSFWDQNYELISIGGQCWFKTSLQTSRFRDGTALPSVDETEDWVNATSPMYRSVDLVSNADTSSTFLYNGWAASHSNQGSFEIANNSLCPSFFHVSTEDDWATLTQFLGDSAGSKLKSAGEEFWSPPNVADNSSGFTALPYGQISPVTGLTEYANDYSYFWALGNAVSSLNPSYFMSHSGTQVGSSNYSNRRGQQVRCVRDAAHFGCTNPDFSEYDATANIDDGSCQIPAIYGCTDPSFIEFNANANTDDGSCQHLIGCSDSDVLEYNGYSYALVTIEDNCWFRENLRSDKFRDGSLIPRVIDIFEWGYLTSAAYDFTDSLYFEDFGCFYNAFAVVDSRHLCPTGWRIPSPSDFQALVTFLGEGQLAAQALKATVDDDVPWNGDNSSGFSATPGGFKRLYSTAPNFFGFGWAEAGFWSDSGGAPGPYHDYFGIDDGDGNPRTGEHYSTNGMNIRCIKE